VYPSGVYTYFCDSNRSEVIDLTLETDWIGNLVRNWHASDEPSLSDHRYILLQIANVEITDRKFIWGLAG
jgi:hypothetical protein